MKIVLSLLFQGFIAVSLVACGGDSSSTEGGGNPPVSAYESSDIEGTWKSHGLASGPGAPWWERGTVTIASDGTFTAVTTDSDGGGGNPSGTLSISSGGEITGGTILGNMDSNKSVIVWTDTWSSGSPGTTEIKVLTKAGATYSTSDLEGTWKSHGLASGPGAPWWERGTVTIASDGTFTAITTDSDGGGGNPSGTLSISSGGEITGGTILGNMDSNKSVIVWTDTWSSGSSGTTEIKILVKELE